MKKSRENMVAGKLSAFGKRTRVAPTGEISHAPCDALKQHLVGRCRARREVRRESPTVGGGTLETRGHVVVVDKLHRSCLPRVDDATVWLMATGSTRDQHKGSLAGDLGAWPGERLSPRDRSVADADSAQTSVFSSPEPNFECLELASASSELLPPSPVIPLVVDRGRGAFLTAASVRTVSIVDFARRRDPWGPRKGQLRCSAVRYGRPTHGGALSGVVFSTFG
ncbi:hypothetical protein HPB50_016762 [Hyalomma asiaticum]|uniref:Uncharacterized protein n=1 Tax=Hyalomma asiaticum TaxID=266040 RepID=A0ACB7SZ68_HYAAI|nr:hypothetical protein HPB50_016762 [Hyalomma asiaticum]